METCKTLAALPVYAVMFTDNLCCLLRIPTTRQGEQQRMEHVAAMALYNLRSERAVVPRRNIFFALLTEDDFCYFRHLNAT
jgi:hypothetical protein